MPAAAVNGAVAGWVFGSRTGECHRAAGSSARTLRALLAGAHRERAGRTGRHRPTARSGSGAALIRVKRIHSDQEYQGNDSRAAFTDVDLLNPRPGLRRHSAHSPSEPEEMGRQAALVSLHDDGSLSLVWAAGGYHREGAQTIPSFMLERAAIDIVSLIGAASRTLSMNSGYSVELGVTEFGGLAVLAPGWGGTYEHAVTTPVRQFQPVRLSIPPQPTDETLLAAARDLALDSVNQAGIAQLRVVRPISA